jgi:hypothetical protein
MWIKENEIFQAEVSSQFKMLDENNFRETLLNICKSNYKNKTLYKWQTDKTEKYLNCFFAISNGLVDIDGVDDRIGINAGSMLVIPGDYRFEIDHGNFLNFIFEYNDKQEVFGNGSKLYSVVSTLRDEYRLSVYANSKEEAIGLANTIPIHEWEHPVVEPGYLETKIVRYARWGNLRAEEV